MRKSILLTAALTLTVLTSGQIWAEEPRIVSRPLSFQEIHDYELPEGTQRSSGLFTVGVGQPVYLGVQVENDVVVTSDVTWSVSGPGSADLESSPLSLDVVPIYTPGRAADHQLLDRQLLIPDEEGQWTVTATLPSRRPPRTTLRRAKPSPWKKWSPRPLTWVWVRWMG